MSNTITRRAALTGTAAGAAAIVAGTGPAIASEADAELRRLWADYLAQEPITRAAHKVFERAADAFEARCGPCPDAIWFVDHRKSYEHTAEWRDRQQTYDLWSAEYDKSRDIVEAIHATPAEGLVGIGIKLAAQWEDWEEGDAEDALEAVLADINRLTGASLQAGLPAENVSDDDGAAYVTGYENLRMEVLAGVDVKTGRPTGIMIREPNPPHSDAEQERRFALNKTVWADPAADRKMADYCIASGRTYPVSHIVRGQS